MTAILADATMTILAALALGMVGWCFFGRMLRPIPGPDVRAVIWGTGDGEHLENSVRSLIWLRGMGLLTCPIVVLDRGLTPRGREIALRVAERWPSVTLGVGLREEKMVHRE